MAALTLASLLLAACGNPVLDAVKRITEAWDPSSSYWVRSYGGSSYDGAVQALATEDGGFVVAGNTRSFGSGGDDLWVAKYGSDAAIQWQYTYGTANDEYGNDLCLAADGGYALVGYGINDSSETYGMVLKIDSEGALVWQNIFSQNLTTVDDYSSFTTIRCLSDGGFFVVGTQKFDEFGDASTLNWDMWVLKLDSTGASVGQWRLDDGAYGYQSGLDVAPTSDGGCILLGDINIVGASTVDRTWVVKLTSSMAIEWQEYFANGDYEYPSSIQQTSDGGYIVLGRTIYPSTTRYDDAWVVKLASSGTLTWSKAYGSTSRDTANVILPTADGYLMAGRYQAASDGSGGDGYLIAMDTSGSILWQKIYGGALRDGIGSLFAWDGGYLCLGTTGYVPATPPTTGDLWLLHLDSEGGPSYASSSLWLGQDAAATTVDTSGSTPITTSGTIAPTAIGSGSLALARKTTAVTVTQLYP
jgi:hypothetical protein